MDIKDIKDLIITMDKTSIERVEIEEKDLKIMITKTADNKNSIQKTVVANNSENSQEQARLVEYITTEPAQMEDQPAKDNIIKEEFVEEEDKNNLVVKSPIVGTFYRAASPDSPPFVNVGDLVKKGQTLCIIEAMKIMNEIECEYEGEIVDIFVDNEDIVEFGEPLMVIRR